MTKRTPRISRAGIALLGLIVLLPACSGGTGVTRKAAAILEFTSASFSALESAGSVSITVRRTGKASGTVSVDYATSDATATSPLDYTAVSGTLNWLAGDLGDRVFSVPIMDDSGIETDESLDIVLSNATGRARLGNPVTATLTIVDDDCTAGSLVSAFGSGGVVTSDPTSRVDHPLDLEINSTHMIVVGRQAAFSPVDDSWRIEKRRLVDGALDPAFGSGGVVIEDLSPNAESLNTVALDADFMYVAGSDGSPGGNDSQWRIEKRRLDDGTLDLTFGTAGAVTTNPSLESDSVTAVVLDGMFLYAVGGDRVPGQARWRIEKRLLSDGLLDPAFGIGGVVVSDPSTESDFPTDCALDGSFLYIVGNNAVPPTNGDYEWRIERRSTTDGVLDSGFGTAGVVTWDSGPARDSATRIAIDSSYMYVVGYHDPGGLGDDAWAIHKRSLLDGALDSVFGSGGIVVSNPSMQSDRTRSIAIDGSHLYVVGSDESPGPSMSQWRVERRSLVDGALDPVFDLDGVVTENPSARGDSPAGVALDSSFIYIIGYYQGPGSREWRVEKRCK